MQLLKLLFLSLILSSCGAASDVASGAMWNNVDPPKRDTVVIRDTISIPDLQCQDLLQLTAIERDSFARLAGKTNTAKLERTNDSLYAKLLVANYKLERVQFYLNIVNRNPSQVKFLRGWINRVLEE